jgi:N-acylneuraminate cytidylyltransferase/CMP-N,N'-diacetyllegionaminic acid synthase
MLAYIPARGGSKRLPGKNIKRMNGKPLIHYSLEVALTASKISRVIFDTDSEEIRDIALQVPGVDAPYLRPAELATDGTQAADLHMHFLDWLKNNEGSEPEAFCILLPTNPLRLPEDIDNSITLFEKRNADIVTSVTRAKPLPWHLVMEADTKKMEPLIQMDAEEAVKNHQELPEPPVHLNGSIYVIRTMPYRKHRSYFGPKTYGYEMPAMRAIDIDELEDFEFAESIMKVRSLNIAT